ncbi:MAG: hypothetical protein ISR60_01040 [Anaerolineales bacterium]|nr:hypothetical protein [Anaerolineales bacterium]
MSGVETGFFFHFHPHLISIRRYMNPTLLIGAQQRVASESVKRCRVGAPVAIIGG